MHVEIKVSNLRTKLKSLYIVSLLLINLVMMSMCIAGLIHFQAKCETGRRQVAFNIAQREGITPELSGNTAKCALF